jgi:hypothetical protein
MAFWEYRPTRTVFQYCSVEGFKGIIKSKSLWFSDLASANDPREIRLGFDRFMNALKALIREDNSKDQKADHIREFITRIERHHNNVRIYCCCFSLVADSLPMWGAYASNYGGISIGFRPTSFSDMPVRVQRVTYLNENTDNDFLLVTSEIVARLEWSPYGRQMGEVFAAAEALTQMTALKHNTWSYEHEIRLLYVQSERAPENLNDPILSVTGVMPDGRPMRWTKPLQRISAGSTINYVAFPFGRWRDGLFDARRAIETVIIGPKCVLGQEEVVALMNNEGFQDFSVTKSDCQIR